MKKKKFPKLKKYPLGGTGTDPIASAADQEAIDAKKNKEAQAAQYAAIGTTAGVSALNYANVYNNPNATTSAKTDAARTGVTATASAINPTVGSIIGGVDAIAAPIKSGAEEVDSEGNLKNKNDAKAAAVVGSFLSPSSFATSVADGTWSLDGEKYTDNIEAEAKKGLPSAMDRQNQNQANIAAQRVDTTGYYAHGGQHGVPKGVYNMGGEANAELEGQEVFQTPNGQIAGVNGPSHNQGGVPVNIPNGTQILSDRLKLGKKTFAQLGAKYKTNKEDKVLSDDKSTDMAKATAKLTSEIKQKKLTELFNTQEALKQSKVAAYAKKMGVTLPQQEFRMGGMKNCYPDGGYKLNRGVEEGAAMDLYNQEVRDMYSQYGNTPQDTTSPDYNPNFNTTPVVTPPTTSASYNTGAIPYENISGNAGSFLGQNAGNFWDLYKSGMGKKYDKVDYGSVNPTLLDNKEALRDADIQSRVTRDRLKDLTNGNVGAYLSNLTGAQTANTLNKAKIREQFGNINAGISNQAKYFNKDLQTRAAIDEAMNKGQASTIARDAVRDIGHKSGASYRDYKATQQDAQTLKWIGQMYPDYKFDTKKGWYFNSKGQPLNIEENKK